MHLNEYQEKAYETNIYKLNITGTLAMALALNEEAGELAGKFSKPIRDDKIMKIKDVALELGDCLWQVSQLADRIGYSLEDIANMNLDKLRARQQKNTISGSGDDR